MVRFVRAKSPNATHARKENNMQPLEGTSRTFNSGGDFGMEKLSKVNELNESMSITPQGRDAYESKLFNIGGTN